MNPSSAFPVTDASQVAEPRRVVLSLASKLSFSEERAGCAALILTELATNLAKHARNGEIVMHSVCSPSGEAVGLEILALDKGPGISDMARSRRNGYSTSGSLGHGLGAVERLADSFDFYTQPTGTIFVARVWRDKPRPARDDSRLEVAAVQISKPGESVCGDGWAWRGRPGRLAICVIDGLGHGIAAHDAARAAKAVFARNPESSPARLVEDAHVALKPTRGAAVAFVAVDLDRDVAVYSGLGNISSTMVLTAGKRQSMVSHNGTAGHSASRIQEFSYPMPAGSILVMCSDGLQSHWDLATYPGVSTRSSSIVAGLLYREFSRGRDDVTVVVAKERPAIERL